MKISLASMRVSVLGDCRLLCYVETIEPLLLNLAESQPPKLALLSRPLVEVNLKPSSMLASTS